MVASDKPGSVDFEVVRTIALSMPSATESAHFERASFRVNNKIFSTLSADKNECVLKLSLADQTALLSSGSETFYEVGWAHQGWIGVNIARVERDTLEALIQSAWQNVAPKKLLKQVSDDEA